MVSVVFSCWELFYSRDTTVGFGGEAESNTAGGKQIIVESV